MLKTNSKHISFDNGTMFEQITETPDKEKKTPVLLVLIPFWRGEILKGGDIKIPHKVEAA